MKLYAWDLATLDLATLGGTLTLHCSSEYRCEVLRATKESVELRCLPLGEMSLVRFGRGLRVLDKSSLGSEPVCAITLEGAA